MGNKFQEMCKKYDFPLILERGRLGIELTKLNVTLCMFDTFSLRSCWRCVRAKFSWRQN